MKISWLTDIHLNFLDFNQIVEFCRSVNLVSDDAVLITGDITTADGLRDCLDCLAWIQKPIYFVLGNHDYYGSSIDGVKCSIELITHYHNNLIWLSKAGVVELTPVTCLIGHEGLADGRLGDPLGSQVQLNDYYRIEELIKPSKELRLEAQNKLGDAAAKYLCVCLEEAVIKYKHIIVALHVSPFPEACWHLGKNTNDEYLPHFGCEATGRVLHDFAIMHPGIKITVYCGHCHSGGHASILPNLEVFTAGAEYREPKIERSIVV